jgi:hypothetical protein
MAALSIYLDQSRFIHLLQARTGTSAARPGASDALSALEDAVASGEAIVPLSVAHYHETWHQHDWRRRHALAWLMRELSGFASLAPIQVVTRQEVETAFGGPSGLTWSGTGLTMRSRRGRDASSSLGRIAQSSSDLIIEIPHPRVSMV